MLTNTSTLKIVHSKSPVNGHDPKFLFPHKYLTVPSVYSKNISKWSSSAKIEASMNYIPPSPPSSMKQCNKSATVKFHRTTFDATARKQSRSGAAQEALGGLSLYCMSRH